MAVPKKRTSKAKTRTRKSAWKKKADGAMQNALSLAKSVLNKDSNFFVK